MTTQADCSIGLKLETVYGTPVVVNQFAEFLTETLDYKPTIIQGKGLRVASRVDRAIRRSVGEILAEGSITLEAPTKGLGIFLNAAMGTVTSTVVAGQTPPVYQQVHTPTKTDPVNSYTIQKGIPPLGGGATTPITFPGAIFLTFIALLPVFIADMINVPFVFGGTSLLIVVGVALDTMAQINQHMLLRKYDGFMKKGRVRFRGQGSFAGY